MGKGGGKRGGTTRRRDFGEAQQIVLINERGQSTKRFCMAVNQRRRGSLSLSGVQGVNHEPCSRQTNTRGIQERGVARGGARELTNSWH